MGPYRLQSVLGQGGMGIVHRAVDTRSGAQVALKILNLSLGPSAIARFLRELRVLGRLTHPGIVRFLDNGEYEGQSFYVMELVQGRDLADYRRARGAMPLAELAPILEQVADCLAYLHSERIYHRDLKPANLMLEPSGRVRVMDFGLVKESEATILTEDGQLLGTPRYMSPESLTGAPPAPALDMWALGITAHELLTGTQAFPDLSFSELLAAISTQPPPMLGALRDVLPEGFVKLHESTLARDPADRPSAVLYRDRLRSLTRPPPAVETPRQRPRPVSTGPRRPSAGIPSTGSDVPRAVAPVALLPGPRILVWGSAVLLGLVLLVLAVRGRGPMATSPSPAALTRSLTGLRLMNGGWPGPRQLLVRVEGVPSGEGLILELTGPSITTRTRSIAGDDRVNFPDLPNQTSLAVAVKDGRGRVRAGPLHVVTPGHTVIWDLAVHSVDRAVLVDFDFEVPSPVAVEIFRVGHEKPVVRVEKPSARTFHERLTGLEPNAEYSLRITVPGGWGGLDGYRFRTLDASYPKAFALALSDVENYTPQALISTEVLMRTPNLDTVDTFCNVFKKWSGSNSIISLRKFAWAAEQLRSPKLSRCALEPLKVELARQVNPKLVLDFVRTVASGRDPECARFLQDLYQRTSLTEVRRRSAPVFVQAGTAQAADILAWGMEADPSWVSADEAPYLLRTHRPRAQVHFNRWAGLRKRVYRGLRECAAQGLALIGSSEAASTLEAAVLTGARRQQTQVAEDSLGTLIAVQALASMDTDAAALALARRYIDNPEDPPSAWGVGMARGTPELVSLLGVRSRDKRPEARRLALWALALVAPSEAVLPVVRHALLEPEEQVRSTAAWAAGRAHLTALVPELLTLIEQGKDRRGAAAWALLQLGRADVVERLMVAFDRQLSTAPDPEGLGLGALAVAMMGLAPGRATGRVEALSRSTAAPRFARDCATEALRRRPAGDRISDFWLSTCVPYDRPGLRFQPGQVVDATAHGWQGAPAGGSRALPLARADEVVKLEGLRGHMTLSAHLGPQLFRLTRGPSRTIVDRPCELVVSPFLDLSTLQEVPMDSLAGLVHVTVVR